MSNVKHPDSSICVFFFNFSPKNEHSGLTEEKKLGVSGCFFFFLTQTGGSIFTDFEIVLHVF